jgi:hypothetical protein
MGLNATQVKEQLSCHVFDKYFVCAIFCAQLSFIKLATFVFNLNNGYWRAASKYVSLTHVVKCLKIILVCYTSVIVYLIKHYRRMITAALSKNYCGLNGVFTIFCSCTSKLYFFQPVSPFYLQKYISWVPDSLLALP